MPSRQQRRLLFNTVNFLTGLMLLVFLMLRTEAQQAAEAIVSEHWSFPDRTDGAVVADDEGRGRTGSRGNCC